MPTQVQFRRGTAAQNDNFTGAIGEISINTSNSTIRVHNGSTVGGFELSRKHDLTTANVTELTNLYYTVDRANTAITNKVNKSFVDALNVNSDTLDSQDGTYYLDWTNTTNKPDPVVNVTLTGDVTGSAQATLIDVTSNTVTISTTIAPNSVALGTDTTGAYVANLVPGTGVSITGLGDEGATPTIAIGQSVATNSDVTFANVTVTGNLLVQGNAVQFTANTLVISDPLIQMGVNPTGDAVDLGFFAHYIGGSPSIERHAGLFRDATDGQFKLFTNLDPEPVTIVDTANASYQSANLVVNFVVGKVTDISNHSTTNLSEGSNLYFTNDRSYSNITAAISTSAQLASIVSDETGSGLVVFNNSPVLLTPNIGTPSAAILTNAIGLPVSSGISGLGTGVATFLATPSSANFASAVTDETGTGLVVFNNSPTLLTPNIGTPSFAVMTNATGTANDLTVNVANNINVTDDTSTNATRYPVFANGTSGVVAENVSSTKLTFNPSSGLLTSTDYNSSSDKRLKKSIKQIDGALAKVNKLKGVSFEWKESGTQALGLIAQDVEKVIPELVTTDDNGFKGIRYNNVIAVLVEAIKEQQDQIKDLQDQVKKLNG